MEIDILHEVSVSWLYCLKTLFVIQYKINRLLRSERAFPVIECFYFLASGNTEKHVTRLKKRVDSLWMHYVNDSTDYGASVTATRDKNTFYIGNSNVHIAKATFNHSYCPLPDSASFQWEVRSCCHNNSAFMRAKSWPKVLWTSSLSYSPPPPWGVVWYYWRHLNVRDLIFSID